MSVAPKGHFVFDNHRGQFKYFPAENNEKSSGSNENENSDASSASSSSRSSSEENVRNTKIESQEEKNSKDCPSEGKGCIQFPRHLLDLKPESRNVGWNGGSDGDCIIGIVHYNHDSIDGDEATE